MAGLASRAGGSDLRVLGWPATNPRVVASKVRSTARLKGIVAEPRSHGRLGARSLTTKRCPPAARYLRPAMPGRARPIESSARACDRDRQHGRPLNGGPKSVRCVRDFRGAVPGRASATRVKVARVSARLRRETRRGPGKQANEANSSDQRPDL
jgi:hypothetical protein